MKRLTLLIAFVGALFIESNAQKFALIDMEYILKNIPAYEMANEQLKQVSEKWEKEVSAQAEKVEALYKEYQANSISKRLRSLNATISARRENSSKSARLL